MIDAILKYFRFGGTYTKKLQHGMAWSVLNSFFEAWQLMALAVVLAAIVDADGITNETLSASLGIMLLSMAGVFVTAHFKSQNFCDGNFSMAGEKRTQIGDRMRYLPMGYFNKSRLGDITSTMTNTLDEVQNAGGQVYTDVISGFVFSCIMCIMLLFMDWRCGLIATATVALVVALNGWMQADARALSGKRVDSQRAIVGAVLEYLQGMPVVRAFSLTGDAERKLSAAIEDCRSTSLAFELKFIRFGILQSLITKAASVLICLTATWCWASGTLETETCLIMIVASFMLFAKIELSGSFATLLRQLDTCMDKVNEMLATPTMDEGKSYDGTGLAAGSLDVRLDHVSFGYDDARRVIDDVTLDVPAGTSLAIVGPSGSGKTTLTQLMARFWDVDAGRVSLGGTDVRDWKVDALLGKFAFVFQGVYLFDDTIENNIKFGRPDATHAEVVEAARRACCDEFIRALPEGYDTRIGEGGAALSGGERQRISIARAILKDAPIVILDEATANVDPENELELQYAIAELCREKTVIMIAHRLKTVRHADRIVVVDKGRIVQSGTHDELMAEGGIYHDFVAMREQAIGWKLA